MFPGCGGIGESCGQFNLTVNGVVTGTLVDYGPFGVQETIGYQILVIRVIAAVSSLSATLGLKVGIKLLSQDAFGLGPCLMLIVLFHGETWCCLDTMVQAFGFYIRDIFRLGCLCDASERLGDGNFGLGGTPDGVGGGAGWLSGWTLLGALRRHFPGQGLQGRTVREFVVATMIVPILFTVSWLGTWGSEGKLRRLARWQVLQLCRLDLGRRPGGERQRLEPGLRVGPGAPQGYGMHLEFAWTRWVVVGNKCGKHPSWVSEPCGRGSDPAALPDDDDLARRRKACDGSDNPTRTDAGLAGGMGTMRPPGSQPASSFVPLQDSVVCHYNAATEDMLFDHLASYGPRNLSDVLSAGANAANANASL